MRSTRLRVLLLALSAVMLFTASAYNSEAEGPPSQPAPQSQAAPAPPPLRNNCSRLFTQKQFRQYTRKVYHRDSISKKADRHVRLMMRCQHSSRAERKMRVFRRGQIAARHLRATMWCGTPTCNRNLGRYIISRRYGMAGFHCIDYIVANESKWRHTIYNTGGSGAYGIPQALPGSKMASAGADWRYNPATQIRWMLGYVQHYGGPCGAAAFKRSHGWY